MDVLKKRWGYLVTAVLILLFMGIGYAFSLFVVPIETDLGLTRADTSFIFTLCFIFFALGSLITGFLIQKIPPAVLLKTAAVMFALGFCTSAQAKELWQLYFTYSICCGLSIGIAYNIMISILPLYFHDKIGLATGALLMGFAMSTTVLGPVCGIGLSVIGWRGVFVILGILGGTVLLTGSVIIHTPADGQKEHLPKGDHKINTGTELPPSGILKTKSYYVFVTIYIAIGGVGMSLINHAAMTLQEDLGQSASVSALTVSFVCLFNGIGRVFWGVIYDRTGAAAALKKLGLLIIVSMTLILLSLSLKAPLLFAAGTGSALFCYGGSSSLAPIIVRALFGDRYFSKNFAVTNIGTMILSSVPALTGTLQTRFGNYTVPYSVLLVFAALSFVMACLYRPVVEKELHI
ncbi:MFS transporter [Lachnospiraceae bacterium 54-53]